MIFLSVFYLSSFIMVQCILYEQHFRLAQLRVVFYRCKKGLTTAIHLFQVDEKSAQSLSVIFLRYWLAETPVAIRKALEK